MINTFCALSVELITLTLTKKALCLLIVKTYTYMCQMSLRRSLIYNQSHTFLFFLYNFLNQKDLCLKIYEIWESVSSIHRAG
jgi:hypothetical protein